MSNNQIDKILSAIRYEERPEVPVAFQTIGPWVTHHVGVKEVDYYHRPELKLKVVTSIQDEFPDVVCIPGLVADYGLVVEPSLFGCQVTFPEYDAPIPRPYLNIKDINKITLPDPTRDGLGPKVMSDYRYFWNNLDKKYIEKYGFLDGVHFTLGPCETAASILGYSKFLYGLYDDPPAIHKLLEIVTETLIRFAKAVQSINGPLKMIYMVEHMPSQVSRAYCIEFIMPYVKQFFNEFASACIRVYHNEGKTEHILDLIPEFGANIYHFGIDATTCKNSIGKQICLMGNVHPLNVLLTGDIKKVEHEVKKVIKICKPGGGFILNSGGGLAPGTPRENIQVMINLAKGIGLVG